VQVARVGLAQVVEDGELWQQRIGGDRRGGWVAARSFLDTAHRKRAHASEGGDLAGAGANHRSSAASFQHIPCHMGFRHGSAWDGPALRWRRISHGAPALTAAAAISLTLGSHSTSSAAATYSDSAGCAGGCRRGDLQCAAEVAMAVQGRAGGRS